MEVFRCPDAPGARHGDVVCTRHIRMMPSSRVSVRVLQRPSRCAQGGAAHRRLRHRAGRRQVASNRPRRCQPSCARAGRGNKPAHCKRCAPAAVGIGRARRRCEPGAAGRRPARAARAGAAHHDFGRDQHTAARNEDGRCLCDRSGAQARPARGSRLREPQAGRASTDLSWQPERKRLRHCYIGDRRGQNGKEPHCIERVQSHRDEGLPYGLPCQRPANDGDVGDREFRPTRITISTFTRIVSRCCRAGLRSPAASTMSQCSRTTPQCCRTTSRCRMQRTPHNATARSHISKAVPANRSWYG